MKPNSNGHFLLYSAKRLFILFIEQLISDVQSENGDSGMNSSFYINY